MESRSEILKELNGISSTVANLTDKLPFALPEHYFDNLAEAVLKRIKEQEDTASPILKAAQPIPFNAPDGYFAALPGNIMQRINAMESSSSAEEEIKALSPLLGRLNRKLPFELPQDYFAALPEEIVSGINAIDFVNQELEALSPEMVAAKNINVYEAPAGYFNRLPQEILGKIGRKQGKVISFNMGRNIMKYAAAAVLTGAVVVSAWMFSQNKQPAVQGTDVAGIEKISDAEIVTYLDKNPATVSDASTGNSASADMQEEDVKELLADVSDKELQQYVEQYTTIKKEITN